jgi:hypothetical protein
MNTGQLYIIETQYRKQIVFQPNTDNTVWLDINMLAKLFDCFTVKVTANIRSLLKSEVFTQDDVTLNYRYTRNGKEYERTYYNLGIVIALIYRITTPNTLLLRRWLAARLCQTTSPKPMPTVVLAVKTRNKDRKAGSN